MRDWLYRMAVRAAEKLARHPIVILSVDPGLVEMAANVTNYVQADISNASPENKHARAFAMLRRLAPEATKRQIGLAIELALRER